MSQRITWSVTLFVFISSNLVADLVIRGVVDGPLTLDGNGGDPKALVFEAVSAIPDLSIYGVGTANNGGGTDGEEFTFPAASASLGDILVVTADITHSAYLTSRFPDIDLTWDDSVAVINGDDPFELVSKWFRDRHLRRCCFRRYRGSLGIHGYVCSSDGWYGWSVQHQQLFRCRLGSFG